MKCISTCLGGFTTFICLSLFGFCTTGCGGSDQPSQTSSTGTFPTVNASSYSFGTQFTGSSVTQSVVTLTNPTSVTFALGTALSGDTSFTASPSSQTCSATLAPNATCTLSVAFAPTAATTAQLSANLVVSFHNLRTTFQDTVTLTGSAVAAPTAKIANTANPQVALYTLNMPAAGTASIQFGPTTAYGLVTSTQTATAAGPLNFFVAGMLASSTYHLQANVQLTSGPSGTVPDQTFNTGAPEFQANITATTTSGMTPQPGIEQLSVSNGSYFSLVFTDLLGRTIWSYAIPGNNGNLGVEGAKIMPNGNLLVTIDQGSAYSLTAASASNVVAVREIDLAGDTVREITIGALTAKLQAAGYNITLQQFHHDVIPMANGHWIVLSNEQRTFEDLTGLPGATTVLGDVVIDLDPNGNPVWVWDSFDHLDVNRHPMGFPDWTHSNTLLYSPDDGNLLLSMRHQNWILKLDYANGKGTGNVLWRLGENGDFKLLNGADPTDWNYAQHFPSFASKRTSGVFSLVLMDNGDDREFPAGVVCGTASNPACLYTTIPIFALDETAKTATLTFHDVLPTSDYSFFGGNAELLGNGNYEFDLAGLSTATAAAYEITPTATPTVVWQMHMGNYAYRAYRVPSLYPGVQW